MADKFPSVTFKPAESRIAGVTASFDPTTLVIAKAVTWVMATSSTGDKPQLEFSQAQGRRLSLRLRFDSAPKKPSVQPELDALMRLALVIDPNGAEESKRPPLVELVWPQAGTLPEFKGVIDRIEVRYLSILSDGTPKEADALVEMEEASRLSFKK